MQIKSCYKILSILITVYFCFEGTDDTLTPEVREEIVRRLNEESEKEVKNNKDASDFDLPAETCQPYIVSIVFYCLSIVCLLF